MNKIICQMIVKDESSRYLKEVLSEACTWADQIIIVDDCSTDDTVNICKSFGDKVQVHDNGFGRSMFAENESRLRNHLWELLRKEAKKGDWVVSLDADEVFSSNFKDWAREFIKSNTEYTRVSFKLLDMWTPTHYRIDGLWSPPITRMFMYKDEPFGMTGTIHCGCLPYYSWIYGKEEIRTDIRLKHLGWVREEDKERKYQFYVSKATGNNLIHALTIKDPATLHPYSESFPKVVIASLIRNRAWCLPEFLNALDQQSLCYPTDCISYLFIVNDSIDDSEKILIDWANTVGKKYREVRVLVKTFGNSDSMEHTWSEVKLKNMADMRNDCLRFLKESDNEFLLSIDSDVILQHHDVLRHLVGLDKGIVSEVFWAKWEQTNNKEPLPNVWLSGGYHLTDTFIKRLKIPGVYEVGGLGAITLIHKDVALAGVSYQRVPNLPQEMRGEDRDFCTRAVCAGFKLWADTYLTPDHLERTPDQITHYNKLVQQTELKQLTTQSTQIDSTLSFPPGDNTISLCMMVKNESKNIKQAIESVKSLVQEIIVVDTGSTDNTVDLAKQFTDKVYNFTWCDDYSAARNYALTKATKKWILFLDGDEMVPPEALKHFYELVRKSELHAVLVPVKNIHIPTKEHPTNFHYSETYRLFRNIPDIRFCGLVHEDIAESLERLAKKGKVGVTRATQFITNLGFLIKPRELETKHKYYAGLILKEIQQHPTNFKHYYEYAVTLLDEGRLDEALKYYDKALELNPTFHMALNDKAVIYLKKAVDSKLLVEAAGCLEGAAISAAKRASSHQQQTIATNVGIVRQMIKSLNIPVDSRPKLPEKSVENLIKK